MTTRPRFSRHFLRLPGTRLSQTRLRRSFVSLRRAQKDDLWASLGSSLPLTENSFPGSEGVIDSKTWRNKTVAFFYLVALNTSLCQQCLMNITVSFVSYPYENQFLQDVGTGIARNVWMKRLEGEVSCS